MDQYNTLFSEEDIRAKVVMTWLADHGFNLADISVEFSFEIRLGRKILTNNWQQSKKNSSQVFRPRADVLVRSCDGRNLLIVEVKSPNESLDDDVREQGICYARLLRKGGIAPFVVLTNGHETKIYDTLSEELISDTRIPLNHPHVVAGFRVNGDDLTLRAEALETFISLSPDNLLEFCRQQVDHRMRLLRDENPYSGKKYIPSLYIEREEAKHELKKYLDERHQRMVLVDGPPQVGKTNFICHTIEERLGQGLPCLFFPAIEIEKGLIEEICEDFQWFLGEAGSAYNIIHNKLQRILRRTNQRLVIFIEGWNEANASLAHSIDSQCERLAQDDITCVISMTSNSASRLLRDSVGNPSHIAQAVGMTISEIFQIVINPEKYYEKHIRVFINKFNEAEKHEAFLKYASIFNVQVQIMSRLSRKGQISNADKLFADPFMLRIAMDLYHDQILPEYFDEPELLAKRIESKSLRAANLAAETAPVLLSELADEMFTQDTPVSWESALRRWKVPSVEELPKGLFEAALLVKIHDKEGLPALDFYYGKERDFAIAYWARKWQYKLKGSCEDVVQELSLASQTVAGLEALRWFLRQLKHKEHFQNITQFFSAYESCSLKETILAALNEVAERSNQKQQNWVQNILYQAVRDSDFQIRVDATELMCRLFTDFNYDIDIIIKILETEALYPVEDQVVEAFHQFHVEQFHFAEVAESNEHSKIAAALEKLLDHDSHLIRLAAAKSFGFIAPISYLRDLCRRIVDSKGKMEQIRAEEFKYGIELAISQLEVEYFGLMCPGYLEHLVTDPLLHCQEYIAMREVYAPIIVFYSSNKVSKRLMRLLESLEPVQSKSNPHLEYDLRTKDFIAQRNALRYQLCLPFEAPNI